MYSTEAWQEKIWPSLFCMGNEPPAAIVSVNNCAENITKNRIIAILIHKVTFYNVIKANKKGKSK